MLGFELCSVLFDLEGKSEIKSAQVNTYWYNADGKKKVMGGPDLKKSQCYPIGFGAALGDACDIFWLRC